MILRILPLLVLFECSCFGQALVSGRSFVSGISKMSNIEAYFWRENFNSGAFGFADSSWLATNGAVQPFFTNDFAPLEGKYSAAILTNGYIRYQFPKNHGEVDIMFDFLVTNIPPVSHTLMLCSQNGSDILYVYHKADNTLSLFVNGGVQANPPGQVTLNRTNRVWIHANQLGVGDIAWTNYMGGIQTRPTTGHPNYAFTSTGNVWTANFINRINLTSGISNTVIFDNGFATDGPTRIGDNP